MSGPAARPGAAPLEALNDIPVRQNDPAMMKLLRAKCAAYDWAQRLYLLQFFTLVILPLGIATWQMLSSEAAWLTGAIGFLLVVVDWLIIERAQKRWKGLGAAFQELFDCTVFVLAWRRDRNGPPPSAELIHRWSERHSSADQLSNWYDRVVGELPPLAAVIVCQRTNGNWNGTMRERYALTLQASVAVLIVVLLAMTLGTGATGRSVFAAVGLTLPLFRWVFKEMTQQHEASSASLNVVERADKLWRQVLDGDVRVKPHAIEQEMRELQNDIFDQRRRDPQVFRWVYSSWRDADEKTMHVGAAALVEEYRRAKPDERAGVVIEAGSPGSL